MSKYFEAEGRSKFENITIDNMYASLCEGTVDVPGNYSPLISIGPDIDLKNINISNIVRNETHCPMPTIGIELNSTVENLSVSNCVQTNETKRPIPFLYNEGKINKFNSFNIELGNDALLGGEGEIVTE